MKYKVGQKVKYFADDTEEWFDGVVKTISLNYVEPRLTQYQVSFLGGDYWLYEIDLLEAE